MGFGEVLVAVVVALVVGCLLTAAWIDHQVRRRGTRPASASAVGRAMRDAKREARAGRARLHMGSASARRSPTNPAPPPWDDRRP